MAGPRNPARAARREIELRERSGTERPICIYCGFAGKMVSFHQHHPLGKNHDPNLTTLVCLNCHARAHEKLLNSGVNMEYEPDLCRRAIMMLRALGIHHELIAESVYKIANGLEEER